MGEHSLASMSLQPSQQVLCSTRGATRDLYFPSSDYFPDLVHRDHLTIQNDGNLPALLILG